MNKQIQELAEQAGLLGPTSRFGDAHEAAERFAALIAAHEREACAKLCDDQTQGKSRWIEGARACAAAIRS